MHKVQSWDFKESPFDDLEEILEEFGIHMYELPSTEGSDTYGFIFSDKLLTDEDIEAIDEEFIGD